MNWPWVALAESLAAVRSDVRLLLDIHGRLDSLATDVRFVLARPPLPPAPPFVCALAEADGPNGPITLGASGRVLRDGTVLELRTQLPLHNVRLTVFCDLERVSVSGMFVGYDLVTAAMGDCPMARFPQWDVGVLVRVQCILRRGET